MTRASAQRDAGADEEELPSSDEQRDSEHGVEGKKYDETVAFSLERLLTECGDVIINEVLRHLDSNDLAMLGRVSRDFRLAVKRSPGGEKRAGSKVGAARIRYTSTLRQRKSGKKYISKKKEKLKLVLSRCRASRTRQTILGFSSE